MIDLFYDAPARPLGDGFRPDPRPIQSGRPLCTLGRWGAMRPIGCVSAIVGLVVGAQATDPSKLATLDTPVLLGIVLLVLGPVLTMLALRFDRRVAAQSPPPAQLTTRPPRSTMHAPHTRTAAMPQRAADPSGEPRIHEHEHAGDQLS